MKEALEKFVPNVSELWMLQNSKPPHIVILKIVKIFFEYGVFNKKLINKIIDILQDKIANLKNLELLLAQEEDFQGSLDRKKTSEVLKAKGEGKKFFG